MIPTATQAERCRYCLYTVDGQCHHALTPTPDTCQWFRRDPKVVLDELWVDAGNAHVVEGWGAAE